MSDDLTANFRPDGSARLFARHAAVLETAEGSVVAGRAVLLACSAPVAVSCSDPVAVAAAAPAVVVCPDIAVAECVVPVGGSGPASLAAELVAAAYPDSAAVVAAPAVAVYPGSVSVVAVDPDSAVVAAVPAVVAAPAVAAYLDFAADRAAFQDSLDRFRFAAGWGDPVCLSCSPAYRRVQRLQESTTTQLH